MKLLNLFFKREMAAPMLALTFASAMSVALVMARIAWTGKWAYAFLLWNVFLAWLPLVFAVFAGQERPSGAKPGWRLLALAGAWLLFFPNAPYIFTDLIHLTARFYGHFWVDLVLILTCALTGLVLGFLSLYLMQSIVTRLYGRVAGWVFSALATGLGSYGIFIGRFFRFNSWDVVLRPAKVYQHLDAWTPTPFYGPVPAAFPILFAAFLFTAYLMLYALTHLSPVLQSAPAETGKSIAAA